MNEGDSAGGGHQGRSPAPPAVPDPRSVLSTTYKQTPLNAIASAPTKATDFNITPALHESQVVNRAISTSTRSFQQTFTQKQPESHSPKQQPITSISSGPPVITSLSAASNQLQHHMQQDSVYYVADVAETTNLSKTQQKPERIFVTQAQPTKSSYLETPSTPETPSLQAKRFKIDTATTDNVLGRSGDVTGSLLPTISFRNERPASVISTVSQDISTLRNLIIEKKYLRLKSIKEEHYDNVAELFYLQSGGNMMDYPAWKKKPPCPQFVKVSNAYRLDHLVNEEVTSSAAAPTIALPPHAAENIAAVIGVGSSPSVKPQPPAQAEVIKTTTQPKLSPLPTTGQPGLKRKRSSSTPPNVPLTVTSSIPARKGSALPQGAEIKIPAVGATPVAVSTQLPAAVVAQLTQQGHIPGRPLGGRHGMVFGQIPAPSAVGNSSIPLVPGGTPLVPCCSGTVPVGLRRNGNDIDEISTVPSAAGVQAGIAAASKPPFTSSDSGAVAQTTAKPGNGSSSGHSQGADASTSAGHSNSVQEFSFKAKQEVYVMQRISELQREGLWTEKRLPKLQEPSRPKAHWDYLLEEMVWLAADFAQERKWKKNAAKKCARMVQKYFQDKANAAQKAEKAQELHLKRIASFISKEVKIFWSNVEKLVEYKHHTKIEEKRKKALDQHLSFIVDQTEKFSQQLAEGMNKSITDPAAAITSAAPSINSSRLSSPKKEETNMSDDEFRPVSSSEDDEETIAKADEEAVDVNAEVVALEKESQMDLDDFINNLPAGYLANRDNLVSEEKFKPGDEEETDDSEFQVNEASDDDEVTISQQEAEESELDYKKELDELEADNDLTVEELMEKYRAKQISKKLSSKSSDIEMDSDDDDVELDSDDTSSVVSESSTSNVTEDETIATSEADENDKEDNGLESLFDDNDRNKDNMINDAAAIAESIQPKGNTLSSTNVVTPVPFLLKHSLREYQHIGLDWLVTMHDRKLNGILADEMGLGKTIQTIALLAHLACVKGNWGPHLIVVPSSVMLNWEMEFKKWCPGFKILTYYGAQKERKLKRVGWTKPNAFHVCITSYKLVTQDQQSFRRKKWKYLILDEAQNIKNFKSQRWQLLLNFSTERRLLLTGTPLQNDLMELWSLMHFLMPYVFSSHREFKEWFSNPMTGMIEGNMEYNESLINRLHKVIRPFLLRRLKKEVEKQMPKKYEHVVMCRLSNRQRYLYDDFMSRAKTKETLQTGNLLSVINILMQLRKVCNHPNMFEARPTISPFQMEAIAYQTPRLVCDILDYDPTTHISLESLNLILIQLELTLTAYVSYKSRQLAPPRKLIEEIDAMPATPPRCPSGRYKFHIRVRDPRVQRDLSTHSASNVVQVGASPAMKMEGNKLVPLHNLDKGSNRIKDRINSSINPIGNSRPASSTLITTTPTKVASSLANVSITAHSGSQFILGTRNVVNPSGEAVTTLHPTSTTASTTTSAKIAKLVQSGKPYFLLTSAGAGSGEAGGGRLTLVCKPPSSTGSTNKSDAIAAGSEHSASLVTALAQKVKTTTELTEMKKSVKLEKKLQAEDDTSSELDPVYNNSEVMQKRKEWRLGNLKFLSLINRRRSEAVPIYGSDCREALGKCTTPVKGIHFSSWHTRGYTNCQTAMSRNDSWTLSKLLKSYVRRCEELRHTFANFVIYVPAVSAPTTRFYTQNLCSNRVQQQRLIETTITRELSPKLALLHPIISAMTTKFPDPRLIQYDCGKLQTLDLLLRQLKTEKHRVLIFTQMTKMLDILEAFLNYHGHIYLRLDGSTRVEQRQALMERFNADKRIFCFILSTRSGGVGINLTGADTVIFYDSDWNPTMDAQAQDRCHRIGQTRDVHIYRLVSEKTIEVNILKKANQKRMLSDMAIEGGNFTTSFLKSSTIKDLFNMENQQERELDTANCVRADKVCAASNERTAEVEMEKQSLRAFESALAAAEDEQDVQATSIAKAEVAADLAEFDENILIDDTIAENTNTAANAEMSKADLEVLNLVKQLSPIERYAMRFVEETGAAWTAEQLRAAEEELEAQKREWEANRQAALLKEEEMLKQEALADETITYSRKDATNQVWISDNTMEQMPIWCPPTPPQNDNDVYIDYSLSYMYETTIIPDAELPPVYARKDYKRSRFEAGFAMDGSRRPSKIRKEDNFFAPRSLFDRPSPAIAKIRRDLKLQRYRGVFKPNVQIPGLKIQAPQKPQNEPEGIGDWTVYEDFAMVYVLANMQGLPCNLMPLSPGHTANWDLVAEIVNLNSKTYRSPKQCRWRYETIVLPREEGKLVESPKKHKKIKTAMKSVIKGPVRSLKTAQMYASDNNMNFIKMMRGRFDAIKGALLKKAPPPKRHYSAPSPMNPKHAEVLQEFGISNYDQPISPLNIAIMKANKMREKQRCHLPPQQSPVVGSSGTQQPLIAQPHQELKQTIGAPATNAAQVAATTQQIQIQQSPSVPPQQAATAAIVMPQSTQHQQLPQLIQTSAQGQAVLRSSSGAHQTATQIVKAIVTPQSGILAGQVQQLAQQQSSVAPQQLQLQSTSSGNIVGAPASVSVVLSTPVQTMSSNLQPHSGSQPSAQIVSVTPQNIVSSASQMSSLVQTITSQAIPQVVSVSQLATVGTVLTTSTNIQPHTTVTTLNTSALRAQRIVAASSGALQDVVLQQRPSNQSPTIVSMAALGQTVTPAQFQTAQLRLASMPGSTQHVVAKGIPVSSLQQSGKIAAAGLNQPTQIQLYRQRQQLKVLQAGQGGQAVVQTVSGQTALVNSAGAIIQGTIGSGAVQVQQGQKVAVATVSGTNAANTSGGSVTPVATVQVAHNQGRAQFIKQVAAKQAIARQVADNEMLLVKRQVIGSHQKAQVLQQGQIFAATSVGSNIQMQQQQQQQQTAVLSSTSSGSMQQQQQVSHQQIATLVKTSSGTVSSASSGQAIAIATAQQAGTVNMALSHIKPGGQIKVTMANQSQMRQLHMQHQHLALGQPRKISKMTQLGAAQASVVGANQHQACVSSTGQQVQVTVSGATTVQKTTGTGNVQTQLVHIQNPKSLPASVTVQQIQQVMRQGQQGTLSAAGLVLGKTSVGRVIPVSVASQPNPRQTIQVVSAASAQAIASGNLRAHVASGQNITGTIKVTGASQSQGQNQQALITAIQQQTAAVQQGQRQNASPVRLQTTIGGNLVAVVQQQQQQQQSQHGSSASSSAQSSIVSSSTLTQSDALTITQASSADTSIQLSTQVTTPQQVRTLVKKKIMQIRSEKD